MLATTVNLELLTQPLTRTTRRPVLPITTVTLARITQTCVLIRSTRAEKA